MSIDPTRRDPLARPSPRAVLDEPRAGVAVPPGNVDRTTTSTSRADDAPSARQCLAPSSIQGTAALPAATHSHACGDGKIPRDRPTCVRFRTADERSRDRGLLGWAEVACGALIVGGLTLRMTRRGRLVVTWPTRRAKDGRQYPLAEPVNAAARDLIEAAVVAAWREAAGAEA